MSPQTSSDSFCQVFFVESVCDDPDVIATNILVIDSRFFQDSITFFFVTCSCWMCNEMLKVAMLARDMVCVCVC